MELASNISTPMGPAFPGRQVETKLPFIKSLVLARNPLSLKTIQMMKRISQNGITEQGRLLVEAYHHCFL